MGCLSRLILWIIRAVAIIALLLCILGAIFMPSERVKFIIGGVVALAIGSATARKTDKIKSNYNGKCSKCGASLANAGFRYIFFRNAPTADAKRLLWKRCIFPIRTALRTKIYNRRYAGYLAAADCLNFYAGENYVWRKRKKV